MNPQPHPTRRSLRSSSWWHLPLVGLVVALTTGKHLGGSWRFDDPLILQYVQTLPNLHTAFINANAWRELGAPFFTPLLTLVFQLAYQLFGLNTVGHYALHLLALTGAAGLTYTLVARHASPLGGLFAAILFILGAPTQVVAAQLMTTHYLWGLTLALLALFMWQRYVATRWWAWAAISAALYLLAMLGKEIYAPLPLVLLALAWPKGWKTSLGLVFHTVAAAIYVPWRASMIGNTVGGYGSADAGLGTLLSSVPTLAQGVWGHGGMLPWLGAASALLLIALSLHAHGRAGVQMLACTVPGLLLPFAFVSASLETVHLRLAFLPWWGLCIGMGFAFVRYAPVQHRSHASPRVPPPPHGSLITGHTACIGIAIALLAWALVPTLWRARAELAQENDVYDAFARHVLAPPHAAWALLQRRAATDPHFQYGLWQMARRQGVPPTTVEALAEQALHNTGRAQGYAYSEACRCMAPHQATTPLQPSHSPLHIRFEAPATRGMQWQLAAPTLGGDWYLQIPTLGSTLQFPASGAIGFAVPPWLLREPFRMVWRSPAGEWVQTPLHRLPALGQTAEF